MKRRPIWFYIILNIIISVLTTLAVISIWERLQSSPLPSIIQTAPAEGAQTLPPASLPPLDQVVIEIENVFGAGDVQNEVVVLKHVGTDEFSLRGWQLLGDGNRSYTFPDVTLISGSVRVFSRNGTDSAVDFYWGRTEPAWQSGGKVTLVDSQSNVRAVYLIP